MKKLIATIALLALAAPALANGLKEESAAELAKPSERAPGEEPSTITVEVRESNDEPREGELSAPYTPTGVDGTGR